MNPYVNAAKKSQNKKQGQNQYAYLELPTNKQLHQETTAATNIAYRPVERQTKANLRASNQRTKNLGHWWNEYLATVNGQQAATAQAYQQAAAQTQGLINTGAQVDQANTAALNAQAAQNAALRGQDASAAINANTQTSNAALSQRNTMLGNMGAATAARGANQYAYLGNQKTIGAGQRVAAMTNEAKRGISIRNDLTSLKKERGEYASKTLGEKQDRQRELQLKRKAFKIEEAGAAASAAAEARKEQREREEKKQEEERKWYEAKHPNGTEGGKSGGLTPSQQQARKDSRQSAGAATWRTIKYNGVPKTNQEWAGLEAIVAKEDGVNAQQAHEAVQRIKAKLREEGRLPKHTRSGQGGVHR